MQFGDIDYKATEQSREIYGKDIINKIHDNGETLLHTAVNKGDKASVDILLDFGSDIFATNSNGEEAIVLITRLVSQNSKKYNSTFKLFQTKLSEKNTFLQIPK